MKALLPLLVFILLCDAATAQRRDLQWLAGTWKLKNKQTFEVWKIHDNGDLSGKAFRLNGVDTVITEVIELQYSHGAFHYIPDVAGSQPPVDFLITTIYNKSFVAENPHHDFPKIIRYRFRTVNGQSHLDASIEGNGKVISYAFDKIE